MMKLWFKAENVVSQNPERFDSKKKGLRLRFEKDVDPEVKRCIKEFCAWLRTIFVFPIRIVIYIRSAEYVRTHDGELVSAKFWGPYDFGGNPYAVIGTGNYNGSLEGKEKDNELAGILCSIGHELTHYYQWVTDPQWREEKNVDEIKKEERQAVYYSRAIVDYYANTREHP